MKNAFNMPVQGFDGISGAVDKLTKLDNESATSFKELAIAMSKTSASAQGVGVDFDHLSAYVATVSSITRKSASTNI
jgi:TP901 family phage tail tape measure protein